MDILTIAWIGAGLAALLVLYFALRKQDAGQPVVSASAATVTRPAASSLADTTPDALPPVLAPAFDPRQAALDGPPAFDRGKPNVLVACRKLGVESVDDPRLTASDIRYIRALSGQPLPDQIQPSGRVTAVYDTEQAAYRRLIILGASAQHASKAVRGVRFGSEVRWSAEHKPELVPIAPILRKEYASQIQEPTPAQWAKYMANWEAAQR